MTCYVYRDHIWGLEPSWHGYSVNVNHRAFSKNIYKKWM